MFESAVKARYHLDGPGAIQRLLKHVSYTHHAAIGAMLSHDLEQRGGSENYWWKSTSWSWFEGINVWRCHFFRVIRLGVESYLCYGADVCVLVIGSMVLGSWCEIYYLGNVWVLFSLSFCKLMVLKPWTIPVQLFRMLALQVAIRTLTTTRRRTTVAEPTSREAMDMPVDAVEDLGSSSLLLSC